VTKEMVTKRGDTGVMPGLNLGDIGAIPGRGRPGPQSALL
jgi:hypothetical protein